MRCGSCGTESPDWSEFCLRCGKEFSEAERLAARDTGLQCGSCAAELAPGSTYCHSCGARKASPVDQATAYRISLAAKLLALIPGIFNVFGLGHLYLGKYRKAFFFLLISIGLRLANDAWVQTPAFPNAEWVWLGISLLVFVVQLWDVYTITDRELFGR